MIFKDKAVGQSALLLHYPFTSVGHGILHGINL
jgi:hypothetical protein